MIWCGKERIITCSGMPSMPLLSPFKVLYATLATFWNCVMLSWLKLAEL
eukprot:gene2124-4246_t